jgi:hypothetical protein
MKKIGLLLFVLAILVWLLDLGKGAHFVFSSSLVSLPLQEFAALFILGSSLVALAGYGKRRHQTALARQSKEDRIC